MTNFTQTKLIRDMLGSDVPQYFNEDLQTYAVQTTDGSLITANDVDFAQTKLLRDALGSPIPQLWDVENSKWVAQTTQNTGGGSDVVTWSNVTGKPSTFPSTIEQVQGLQEQLNLVFQQVSSGKQLLETAIESKGSSVNKSGDVATFDELKSGILSISTGSGSTSNTRFLFQSEYDALSESEKNNGMLYFIKE